MADHKEALRIKKRLVALKRGGVHRVKDKDLMPTAIHIVGIGKTGADFIAQLMRQAPDNFHRRQSQALYSTGGGHW